MSARQGCTATSPACSRAAFTPRSTPRRGSWCSLPSCRPHVAATACGDKGPAPRHRVRGPGVLGALGVRLGASGAWCRTRALPPAPPNGRSNRGRRRRGRSNRGRSWRGRGAGLGYPARARGPGLRTPLPLPPTGAGGASRVPRPRDAQLVGGDVLVAGLVDGAGFAWRRPSARRSGRHRRARRSPPARRPPRRSPPARRPMSAFLVVGNTTDV